MTPTVLDAETLFRRHAPFVAGFCVRLGVRDVDVDDVVQEVFLVAHRRGGYVVGPARPTTWLAEICVRVIATRRRTARRRPETPDPEALLAVAALDAGPAEALEAHQMLAMVSRALEALDLDRRALFVLFEIEGESCADIAAAMGLTLSTVYSRLHAARKVFLEAYARCSAGIAPAVRPLRDGATP